MSEQQAEESRNARDFVERADCVLSHMFHGLHNVPGKIKRENQNRDWPWIEVCIANELATFDFDAMTRAVIAAHHHCVRVSVRPASPQYIRICIHNRRGREGSMSDRHPNLSELRNTTREYELHRKGFDTQEDG